MRVGNYVDPFFMDFFSLGYFGLFFASFLSATVVPFSSEGILLLFLSATYSPISCLFVATIGNSLGGITNYLIGSLGNPLWLKRFGINENKVASFEKRIQKFGFWLAFFSWVPIIGDPLTIALGFFKVPFWKVLILLIIGKFLRYFILVLPWVW